MKRDFDLIRLILLEIEKTPAEKAGDLIPIKLEGFTSPEISYHVGLLEQAGLVKAFNFAADDLSEWIPSGLTWEGHEFLDAARDSKIWDKAKALVLQATGVATIESFKIAFKILIDQLMTGRLGI